MSLLVNYEFSDDENEDVESLHNSKKLKLTELDDKTKIVNVGDELVLPNEPTTKPNVKNKNEEVCSNEDINGSNYLIETDNISSFTTSNAMFKNLPPSSQDESTDEKMIYENVEMIVLPTEAEIKLREKPPVKSKRKIVIALPQFEHSDSDDEEKTVKPQPKTHGSSLTSLLPDPKIIPKKELNRPLIPHSLTKPKMAIAAKAETATSSIGLSPQQQLSSAKTLMTKKIYANINLKTSKDKPNNNASSIIGTYYDDDDSFSDVENETDKKPTDETDSLESTPAPREKFHSNPSDSEEEKLNHAESLESERLNFFFSKDDDDDGYDENNKKATITHPSALYKYDNIIGSDSNFKAYIDYEQQQQQKQEKIDKDDLNQILTKEQIAKLQGKRHKNKDEPISMVDVDLSDHIGQYEIDRTKNFTLDMMEMESHSKKKNDKLPTQQQKRKHQITYLAQQAKEKEFELKNQWAENRFNKRQTQSKYGF